MLTDAIQYILSCEAVVSAVCSDCTGSAFTAFPTDAYTVPAIHKADIVTIILFFIIDSISVHFFRITEFVSSNAQTQIPQLKILIFNLS